MAPWLTMALFCLSVYRVSRFITMDQFPPIVALRRIITKNLPANHWLAYMIGTPRVTGCPWCVSIWIAGIGAGILGPLTHWWDWPHWVMLCLASSAVTGLIGQKEPV